MYSLDKNCTETHVNVNPTSINVCISNLSNIGCNEFDNMSSSRCSSSSCSSNSGNSSNSSNSGNSINRDMQGTRVWTSTPTSTPLVSNTGQRWSLNKLNNSNCNSNWHSNCNLSCNINISNASSNGPMTHYNTLYQEITKVNNMNSNMSINNSNHDINYYKNGSSNLNNINWCNVEQVYNYLIKHQIQQQTQQQLQQEIEQEMTQERGLIGQWCIVIPSGTSCESGSVNRLHTNNTNICINNSVNTNYQTTYSNKYSNDIGSCEPTIATVGMIEADACLQLHQIVAQNNTTNVLHTNPIWNCSDTKVKTTYQQLGSQAPGHEQEQRQEEKLQMRQTQRWYDSVDKLLLYIKRLRTHQHIIINHFNVNKSSQYFAQYTRKVKQIYDDYIDRIIELFCIFIKGGDDGNFKQT